jgi:catechol 2,3-dioxygenase-like lactoylglutathione lyase family enzyme
MGALKPGHVLVYSLWTEDVPATVHFYRDVIGLELIPGHGQHPTFGLGHGAHLVIVQGQRALVENTGHSHFPQIAFIVDDLDAFVAHLESHGVALPWGIRDGHGMRWVVFRDPAGNLIELAQPDSGRTDGAE